MICNRCKTNKTKQNYKLCGSCLLTQSVNQKIKLKEKRKSGICYSCSNKSVDGKRRCNPCLKREKELKNKAKDSVFNVYGGYVCACCGETEKDFLTLDHINGGGCKHRREMGNGKYLAGAVATVRWAIKNNFPSIFQILCYNCNASKHKNGVCIHKL